MPQRERQRHGRRREDDAEPGPFPLRRTDEHQSNNRQAREPQILFGDRENSAHPPRRNRMAHQKEGSKRQQEQPDRFGPPFLDDEPDPRRRQEQACRQLRRHSRSRESDERSSGHEQEELGIAVVTKQHMARHRQEKTRRWVRIRKGQSSTNQRLGIVELARIFTLVDVRE